MSQTNGDSGKCEVCSATVKVGKDKNKDKIESLSANVMTPDRLTEGAIIRVGDGELAENGEHRDSNGNLIGIIAGSEVRQLFAEHRKKKLHDKENNQGHEMGE